VGARLEVEQVRVERGRPADGLARVVDQDVEPGERALEVAREDLDGGGVPQVQAVDVQAVLPVREVALARVALRGVVGEARGGDHRSTGAEHLEGGLEADLDPRPRDHGDPAVEGDGLEALVVIEGRAIGAQRVIEEVEAREVRLADVAALRLLQRRTFGGGGVRGLPPARPRRRGEPQGRGGDEHGGQPRGPDPRRGAHVAIGRLLPLLLPPPELLHQPRRFVARRARGAARGEDQRLPLLRRHVGEERAVGDDRLQ
jgi:hypothetical protein